MKPTQDNNNYPVFEANQVLSYTHLNQVFNYLDEQERLTRANLIGTGIVCGLKIVSDETAKPVTIHLSKGCGITSEGYLIVEPANAALVSYRDYTLPNELGYPQFRDGSGEQYPLWELFQAGEPEPVSALDNPPDFLADKAVILFLELKKEMLRNCSPNNCDDKGASVTATVRRLLIRREDLEKVINASRELGSGLSSVELRDTLADRIGLQDIRLPRYDVPNSGAAATEDVLAAFLTVFRAGKQGLAGTVGKALSTAYVAFRPIVRDDFPEDPFSGFSKKFGFLDSAPDNQVQVRFIQYYYDLFDDLLKAYDEFRWKGINLICACCPPGELFPRHLMLGIADGADGTETGKYRQQFVPSPAVKACRDTAQEVKLLFRRLVQMTAAFTDTPLASELSAFSKIDRQVRITPSRLSDLPLSQKAIPYYYLQNGNPPLYTVWNNEKTSRNRANQNLSYRSDEYLPVAPPFVRNPLAYDLEPYNFLRIEGHLGKNYRNVLRTLLQLKNSYRLPVEIIALRAGAFDENIQVDLSKEAGRFQDLETLYDSLKAELACFLCRQIQYFYNLPYSVVSSVKTAVKPKLPFLASCAPGFMVQPKTLGRFFEDLLGRFPDGVIPEGAFDVELFSRLNKRISGQNNTLILMIVYMSKLSEELAENLAELDYANFEKRYQALTGLSVSIENKREQAIDKIVGSKNLLNWEELDDRLEDIIYNCRLDSFKTVYSEYLRRIREVRQKQFLSHFLQSNPGISHKAGVPLGGTFILVYHENPPPARAVPDFRFGRAFTDIKAARPVLAMENIPVEIKAARPLLEMSSVLGEALNRIQSKGKLLDDPDIQLVFGELTGRIPVKPFKPIVGEQESEIDKIIAETVSGLDDGTVIADFYLPYICSSGCTPVQYLLPPEPLGLVLEVGCTGPTGVAEVTLTPKGGMAPFSYQLDKQPFKALDGKLLLNAGAHSLLIRDSQGSESPVQSFVVPDRLAIGPESYTDDQNAKSYVVSFDITGGIPPYVSESGSIKGSAFTGKPVKSGEGIDVIITDNAGCKASKNYEHTVPEPCKLPCKGIALHRGYHFSLPFSNNKLQLNELSFTFEYPKGKTVDLSKEVGEIIAETAGAGWSNESFAKRVNELISKKSGSGDWLIFSYATDTSAPQISLDTWEIEHFECLKFELKIAWSYSAMTNLAPSYMVAVNTEGSSIRIFRGDLILADVKIPAFDTIRIDKCNPDRPSIDLCKGLDIVLDIVKKMNDNQLTLDVEASGNAKPTAWLWEVQDGTPLMANGKQTVFSLANVNEGEKQIRLTAFTDKGCRAVATDILKPG